MQVSGECYYVSAKSGTKQDGSNWYNLKFLDEENDEFFVCFIKDQRLWDKCSALTKRTPVLLTLNLVPGSKYFSLESVEIIEYD